MGTGNRTLDQLKVDMVVDAVLPTRGKRRSDDSRDPRLAKQRKITPVDHIPSRLKLFSVKLFRRIKSGEITRSYGYQQIQLRLPGLTHSGYVKEYNRWVRENPEPDEKKDEPGEEKHTDIEEVEEGLESQVKKEMSIKLVNILSAEGDHLKDDGGGDKYLKLKSIKESLVEILGIGDFNEDEKRLLKEIKELIDI